MLPLPLLATCVSNLYFLLLLTLLQFGIFCSLSHPSLYYSILYSSWHRSALCSFSLYVIYSHASYRQCYVVLVTIYDHTPLSCVRPVLLLYSRLSGNHYHQHDHNPLSDISSVVRPGFMFIVSRWQLGEVIDYHRGRGRLMIRTHTDQFIRNGFMFNIYSKWQLEELLIIIGGVWQSVLRCVTVGIIWTVTCMRCLYCYVRRLLCLS